MCVSYDTKILVLGRNSVLIENFAVLNSEILIVRWDKLSVIIKFPKFLGYNCGFSGSKIAKIFSFEKFGFTDRF